MFRHHGKNRTFKHNLRIASLLSFVAGVVNVAGFLSVQKFTTNITGHFALFVDEVFSREFWNSFHFFLYILFFFLGSFFAGFSVEIMHKINDKMIYRIPILVESSILSLVAIFGTVLIDYSPNTVACALLFAMGLQNALVTKISNSIVRTTHLTGLFTDLGIEISQLFFYKEMEQKKKLTSSIRLRFTIISFFFLGGVFGGIMYSKLQLHVLIIVALLLLIGLVYDQIKIGIKRKLK